MDLILKNQSKQDQKDIDILIEPVREYVSSIDFDKKKSANKDEDESSTIDLDEISTDIEYSNDKKGKELKEDKVTPS